MYSGNAASIEFCPLDYKYSGIHTTDVSLLMLMSFLLPFRHCTSLAGHSKHGICHFERALGVGCIVEDVALDAYRISQLTNAERFFVDAMHVGNMVTMVMMTIMTMMIMIIMMVMPDICLVFVLQLAGTRHNCKQKQHHNGRRCCEVELNVAATSLASVAYKLWRGR